MNKKQEAAIKRVMKSGSKGMRGEMLGKPFYKNGVMYLTDCYQAYIIPSEENAILGIKPDDRNYPYQSLDNMMECENGIEVVLPTLEECKAIKKKFQEDKKALKNDEPFPTVKVGKRYYRVEHIINAIELLNATVGIQQQPKRKDNKQMAWGQLRFYTDVGFGIMMPTNKVS